MLVVMGLGNPEAKYTYTRHNAGFLALDRLAEKHGFVFRKEAHRALIAEGRLGGERVALAKPLTYMNHSGRSAVELINWYKIDPAAELLVLYDDIDLDVGDIRIRARGSAGSHNGMKDIIYLTGRDDFPRVRIGVGHKPPDWDLAHYVLSGFLEEEKQPFWDSLGEAGRAVELIARGELLEAQSLFNKKAKTKKKQQGEHAEKQDSADSVEGKKAAEAAVE